MTGKFGVRNTRGSKLTLVDVAEIRSLYEGGATQGSLARMFNISVNQIGRIVRGESWHQPAAQSDEQIKIAAKASAERLVARLQAEGIEVPGLEQTPVDRMLAEAQRLKDRQVKADRSVDELAGQGCTYPACGCEFEGEGRPPETGCRKHREA